MKKLILLLSIVMLSGCSLLLETTRPSYDEVLYHVPYASSYPSLPQSIDVSIPDGIKWVTVYVGFNTSEGGGAYSSFEVYLGNLLEVNSPNYGCFGTPRNGDTITGVYWCAYTPIMTNTDKNGDVLNLKCTDMIWHDGAIIKHKEGVKDYGITKVIGHY